MAFVGADIEQMQALENTLKQQSQALEQIMNTVKTKVHGTDWRGPDADQFRNEWDTQHTSTLKNVAAQLDQVAAKVRSNWQQQQQTSGS